MLRARYKAIMSALIAPDGPLWEVALHAFLDAREPVLSPAMASDPLATEPPSAAFAAPKNWMSTRIPNVVAQVAADGPPAPR